LRDAGQAAFGVGAVAATRSRLHAPAPNPLVRTCSRDWYSVTREVRNSESSERLSSCCDRLTALRQTRVVGLGSRRRTRSKRPGLRRAAGQGSLATDGAARAHPWMRVCVWCEAQHGAAWRSAPGFERQRQVQRRQLGGGRLAVRGAGKLVRGRLRQHRRQPSQLPRAATPKRATVSNACTGLASTCTRVHQLHQLL
jgi:hypothetical protein